MARKKNDEVTVTEASKFLGVTARTVLNYIQAKEIEAIKVGKSWYINAFSLDAFAQKYNIGIKEQVREQTQERLSFPPSAPLATQGYKESRQVKSRQRKDKGENSFSVKDLHAFKVATEVYLQLDAITALVGNVTIQEKMKELYYEAMEYIGAGYYSFESYNKKQLYNKSREKVGGILSLIYANQDEAFHKSPPEVIKKIEDDLLPAFSGLIRKMDRASRKKYSSSPETKEGHSE